MNDLDLFNRTKQRLALSYAGVMGLILSLLGIGVYEFTIYDRQLAIDREIESVAGTIHDSLEPKLIKPNRISPAARLVIPNLCLAHLPCNREEDAANRHITGVLGQGKYYLVLLNLAGEIKATSGAVPADRQQLKNTAIWMDIIDAKGQHYRQFSIAIHSANLQDWGELRIGRNIEDLASSLAALQFILLTTIPIAIFLIAGSSWYLAGRAMQPIYESYDRLQVFTANVAHELRTPLATNQLTLDEYILSDDRETDPQVIKILNTVRSQNMRLIRLVGDLLLLARLDRAKVDPDDSTCNLDEIVEDLAEEFNLLTQAHEIIISIPDPIKPIKIQGDADRVSRLVGNLLENAIKYSPTNSEIIVNICPTRSHIRLSVTDRGIGIAPDERSKIFDRFYRVDSDRSRETGGTGLGLAIVKSIANLYGAKVRVKSQLGAGSTFIIDFPRSIDLIKD